MTNLRMLIGVRLIGRLSRTAEMSPGQDQRVKDVIQRLIWHGVHLPFSSSSL